MPSLANNKDKPTCPQFKGSDRRKEKRKQCKKEEKDREMENEEYHM